MMRGESPELEDDSRSYATALEAVPPVLRSAPVAEFASGTLQSSTHSDRSLRGREKPREKQTEEASTTRSEASPSEANTPRNTFSWDNAKKWWQFGSGTVDKNVGPAWIPDEAVKQCTGCARTFDFFNRKHHCRHCGQIFCNACSSDYKILPVEFGVREPQRCCRNCAMELEPLQEELSRTIANQNRDVTFDPTAPSKYLNPPVSFSLTAEITKAAHTMENIFGHVPNAMITVDRHIPETLLRNAKGIAFLTVLKGGFLVSGKVGTGLVIAKLDTPVNGVFWSPPSAIGMFGVGWGAQIGGELTNFVMVLTSKEALDAFSGTSQVAIGAELGISVGPLGRSGEASLNIGDSGLAPVYAYSQSSGLFAGISLEGSVITSRTDVNRRFYGRDIPVRDLLTANGIAPPRAAMPLYQSVQKVFSMTSGDAPEVGSVVV